MLNADWDRCPSCDTVDSRDAFGVCQTCTEKNQKPAPETIELTLEAARELANIMFKSGGVYQVRFQDDMTLDFDEWFSEIYEGELRRAIRQTREATGKGEG